MRQRAATLDLSQIKCVKCGLCCPNDCRHKKKRLCGAHPSRIGKRAARLKRGHACHMGPEEIFSLKCACPPVVRAVREAGFSVQNVHRDPKGVTVYDNAKQLYSDPGFCRAIGLRREPIIPSRIRLNFWNAWYGFKYGVLPRRKR
jgi:hypothetical protein